MTIRTAIFTKVLRDRTLPEALEIASDLGYDGVEPMGRDPHLSPSTSVEEVEAYREQLDELGLEVPCLATYTGGYVAKSDAEREAELEELETFLEFANILGCDLVRHNPGGPPVREATDEMFETAAEWLRRAADRAAARDVRLAVEVHAHQLTETAESTIKLLDMVDRENVGAIHDAGNMYIVDTDFGRSSVERLDEKLFHVHVKDELRITDSDLPGAFELETDRGEELFRPALLGDGGVDHEPLFAALTAGDYDGFVTDECHIPQDAYDDVEVARRELAELERLIERTAN